VLLVLESVFGALSSVVLLNELLTPRLPIGFVLTFYAVVTARQSRISFSERSICWRQDAAPTDVFRLRAGTALVY